MAKSPAVALAEALAGVAAPVPIKRILAGWSLTNDLPFPLSEPELAAALETEAPAGTLRDVLRGKLAQWDHLGAAEAEWADGTEPNSSERRERVYALLEIPPELLSAIRRTLPPVITDERTVVIERGGYERWYTPERRVPAFYWGRYAQYLAETQGWAPENVTALDAATSDIVERLADPTRSGTRQTKGLVVGHVQSGKTANLTGVIAKAADAGYRLVIVLSGLTDLLRNQTQRRIDTELIGQELIHPSGEDPEDEDVDYVNDPEWGSFTRYGGLPSTLSSFDWVRLTGERWDYKRLKAGIESLQFTRRDPSKSFFAPENLAVATAKIMIVKKHSGRIRNVLRDLERIKAKSNLAEVPALIIDDESDQASVNTAKPSLDSDETKRRSRINERIVDLLELLPRSQYIGYTATPFANVLISADDEVDLFPRDFIISLSPPSSYLGARDFHDLDGPPPGIEADPYLSKEKCFVRDVQGDDDGLTNLPEALDSFVLAGAIKLWREAACDGLTFRHHTMLIHSSQLTAEHERLRKLAADLFDSNSYDTAEGTQRLSALWDRDHVAVSRARAGDVSTPGGWRELKPFIGQVIANIRAGDGPVIVVNGTDQGVDPDFDLQPVWKILVGGAKLSRGYTIEGLTVSYFRRRATAGDALMQMGRWFGYRTGYRDLVRLYISREEHVAHRSYDLYEAFEATCRDEEMFRSQLRRYALASDDDNPIRPIDVPPLVYSHLEWLPPVPKNKRLNARISFENLGGQWREPTMAATEPDRIGANSELFRQLLIGRDLSFVTARTESANFDAWVAAVGPDELIDLIRTYRWAEGHGAAQTQRIVEFLEGTGDRDPGVEAWTLVAPQLQGSAQVPPWAVGKTDFTVKRRARVSPDGVRVKAYSEPVHRRAAAEVVGLEPMLDDSGLQPWRDEHRGVMLFYPAHHLVLGESAPDDFTPTMGFALLFPPNPMPQRVTFVTRTNADVAFVGTHGSGGEL